MWGQRVMENGCRQAGRAEYTSNYGDEHGARDEQAGVRDAEATFAGDAGLGNIVRDTTVAPHFLAIAAIQDMPRDVWRVVVTHLGPTDILSVRCTAQSVRLHLTDVSNAILYACHVRDQMMRCETVKTWSSPDVIERCLTVGPEVRSDMIKRYAKQAGMACFAASIPYLLSKLPRLVLLKSCYFKVPTVDAITYHEQSAATWRHLIDTSKVALLQDATDIGKSVALCDLYIAEMFAPLLGVISHADTHTKRVIGEALVNLSKARLMDFLYALDEIKHISPHVTRAYEVLSRDFDRSYPMPRVDLLSEIVFLTLARREALGVRDDCLNRMGIDSEHLTAHVMPRVTERIVESLLEPSGYPLNLYDHLNGYVSAWGGDDASFLHALHQSFITVLARKSLDDVQTRSSLNEQVRTAWCTQTLGMDPGDCAQRGLEGLTIMKFWDAYFHIAATKSVPVRRRVMRLPWPLQAALWRLAADKQALPKRALFGRSIAVNQEILSADVEALCAKALKDDIPECAISVLVATLKWQITRACHAAWERDMSGPVTNVGEIAKSTVALSQLAWTIFVRCTIAQRLPVLATLFSYRNLSEDLQCAWPHDQLVSANIVAFLSDPGSSLTHPSAETVDVVLHYLPLCEKPMPEFSLDIEAMIAAISERFDIPQIEVMRALELARPSQKSMRFGAV
ncbi:hypothetical protein [Robbsia sp. KACC 23696]|uniref:hypothetical protein n=1 Tax=Robbsia sp. KACC 23696 TaxID=3149231 RepID=UPI00325B6DD5